MKATLFRYILAILPVAIFWSFNYQNIPLKFSLLLGLIAFPYVVRTGIRQGGYRYAVPGALAGGLLLFFRSSSLFYFSSVFIVLFVLEKWWGRLNHLPLLLAAIVSPVINTIVYTWSFPIRLQLSQLAGKALQCVQMDITVQGNVLTMNGNTFSVDPACIGLKMVITSLVLGIVILGYFEKKYDRNFRFGESILLLGLILLGAVFANFIRLLMLILFHILPGNPLHDVVGLLSLGVYVLLPFYLFVKFVFRGKPESPAIKRQDRSTNTFRPDGRKAYKYLTVFLLLVSLQIFNSRKFLQTPVENIEAVQNLTIGGFSKEITPNGVLKFRNGEVLIYIKPPVRFFQGSHDPRICWRGSGYTFSEIEIRRIGGKSVYTAMLSKEDDTLYTAWWYENSADQTPHDWVWRLKNLKGNNGFYMINISCADRQGLDKWIQSSQIYLRNAHK